MQCPFLLHRRGLPPNSLLVFLKGSQLEDAQSSSNERRKFWATSVCSGL